MHFILKRHPQEALIAKTDREFLRTAGNLKMEHLKKFVTIKVGQKVDMDIVIVTGDSTVALEDGLTLNDGEKNTASVFLWRFYLLLDHLPLFFSRSCASSPFSQAALLGWPS